jgi:hypothetical protein
MKKGKKVNKKTSKGPKPKKKSTKKIFKKKNLNANFEGRYAYVDEF